MRGRYSAALMLTLMLLAPMAGLAGADEGEPERSCEILVDFRDGFSDWDTWEDRFLHRYRVVYEPEFENGTSPSAVTIDVQHTRAAAVIATEANASYNVAGGEIDLILPDEPEFLDQVSIEVTSAEATCSRSLEMTMWNQPTADHEITRETTWSLENDETGGSSLHFEGRGWQKRTGETLTSSELGNGTLVLDADTGTDHVYLHLELDRMWMNETYEGTEITRQIFEMRGSGALIFQRGADGENVDIEANVHQAYLLRDWENGVLTERLTLEATGYLSYNGGSNNSTGGAFGELSVFYLETWDEDGVRRLSDTQIEANMSIRMQSPQESFTFELDEFRMREKWLDGVRTDQSLKIKGEGEFGFLVQDSQWQVQVNGTIPDLHIETLGGEVVQDRIIVDGEYSGDASGSFGLVREIEESTVQENATGDKFEVDVIRNEFWFNISGTPIGPISQEIEAEHNLTFEYTVPQTDWENRTIRYLFVEDDGNTTNEYPERSPIQREPERPSYDGDLNVTGFRESGVVPDEVRIGDTFSISKNGPEVEITGIRMGMADGHEVELADWVDTTEQENFTAYGSIINEGILAGLLHEVHRELDFSLPLEGENSTQSVRVVEHQTLERVLYPSVITAAGNTPPALLSLGFREGALFTEGGVAHLEATVDDVDTDVVGVAVDLTEFGLGIVTLSDTGLDGDAVIHDSVWTARIVHDGLEHGLADVPVKMDDLWTDVEVTSALEVTNAAPRITSREYSPDFAYRGDTVEASLRVEDGHGVTSVAISLLSAGGELTQLALDDESGRWVGQFVLPDSLAPGQRTIPVHVEDGDGASALIDAGAVIEVLNEAPTISNVSFLDEGEWAELVEIPRSGEKTYTIEATIDDPDGVSSAQVKMGRLAPIGQSESWLLLNDEGENGDRVAGDGIFTTTIGVRATLTEGEMNFLVRASDIYQAMTPEGEQIRSVELVDEQDEGGSGSTWLADNATTLILVGLLLLLALAATAVVLMLRNADLE